MKKRSVKLRITVWLTLLLTVLSVILVLMMLVISSTVATGTAIEWLTETVENNVAYVEMTDGKPIIGSGFRYQQGGVSSLIYSKSETLLAGQPPLSFTANEPFQSGDIRIVDVDDSQYLILDVWIPSGWEDGVWLRGLLEKPNSGELAKNLIRIAVITLPIAIGLGAFGGYRVVKRAFRPLDSITATAEAINEARDLSGRIGLPPGKDEFSRLAADFDRMFERLERSFEAEKRFTADASHELRTPVSIIKSACEYAEKYGDSDTPEERRETISIIHRQADRMSRLIAQLLSMTRMDQGTELSEKVPLDLGELAAECLAEYGQKYPRLYLQQQKNLVVTGNRELLKRLLHNLIENGFKYGDADGSVWVTVCLSESGKEILLSVRDDGIGIPESEQEKIWTRFYQVDSARSREEGAGLGLSMVKQIAELHGGKISLQSRVGEGSVFTLHLPRNSETN